MSSATRAESHSSENTINPSLTWSLDPAIGLFETGSIVSVSIRKRQVLPEKVPESENFLIRRKGGGGEDAPLPISPEMPPGQFLFRIWQCDGGFES